MENNIITEVAEYCERAGVTPVALGIRVSQNSRLVARLDRRIAIVAKDTDKLRAYIAAHPAEVK